MCEEALISTTTTHEQEKELLPVDEKGKLAQEKDANCVINDNPSKISAILKGIFSISLPCIITAFCDVLWDVLGVHFIGKLNNTTYLAAVGVGCMWSNISTLSISFGFSSALQTLCSQSNGNKQYYLSGVYHLRARLIMLLMSVGLSILVLYSERVFLMLGLNKDLAHHAAMFSISNIPANIILLQSAITRTFLLSMKIVKPITVLSIGISFLSPLLYYYFIIAKGYYYYGLAIANTIRFLITFVSIIAYIHITKCCGESWFWFNKDCFKEWGYYLKLGSYGAMMVCFEWWGFELTNAFTSIIGTVEVACNTTVFNIIGVIYRANGGLMESACVLVGNCIGELKIKDSKRYALYCELLGMAVTFFSIFAILSFKESIVHFYTHDPAIEQIMYSFLLLYACLLEPADVSNGILTNILKSLAMQKEASIVNFISYYIVMVPVSAYAAFRTKHGIKGVWIGIILGSLTQTCFYIFILMRSDWKKIALSAVSKLKDEKGKCEK